MPAHSIVLIPRTLLAGLCVHRSCGPVLESPRSRTHSNSLFGAASSRSMVREVDLGY